MSRINLKRFVDVNIQPRQASSMSGVRDTIALFTPTGTLGNIVTIKSLNDVTYDSTSDTYKYLKLFFDNGGICAKVYEGIAYTALTTDIIKSLPNEIICVACVCSNAEISQCYSQLSILATNLNNDETVYGINEKIIFARTNTIQTACVAVLSTDTEVEEGKDYYTRESSSAGIGYLNDGAYAYTEVAEPAGNPSTSGYYEMIYTGSNTVDTRKIKNFAVKFSTVIGAEMTMLAYLSKINIDNADSIEDYMFTQEIITAENITDELYGELQETFNVDILLANAIRNCGGNMKDGQDMVNNYTRIVLHQTLTNQLMILLSEKIKSTSGVSKLYAVIAQELEKYKVAGYLTTDKVWLENDLKITYNNTEYTIISKGDALLNGYVIKILPMTALSPADKLARKAPPIYVVIADQYSIRKITISGEVI